MERWSTLLVVGALAAACSRSDGPDGGDTDVGPPDRRDTDPAPLDACAGPLEISLAGAPERLRPAPSWEDEASGAVLTLLTHPGGYDATRAEGGCLLLSPAVLRVDLVPTGCGGTTAALRVTPTCHPSCTELELWVGEERVGATRNNWRDEEGHLELTPSRAFGEVVLRALDTEVCGITITRTALPESLRPEHTGALF